MNKIFLGLLFGLAITMAVPSSSQALVGQMMQQAEAKQTSMSKFLESIGIKDGQIIPKNCTGDAAGNVENCGISEMLQVVVNISQVILGISGSLLFLMFIYGGVLWIISQGSSDKIQQGKDAIKAAVIGIIIILGAWLIVNTLILALTGGKVGNGPAKIFTDQRFDTEPNVQ